MGAEETIRTIVTSPQHHHADAVRQYFTDGASGFTGRFFQRIGGPGDAPDSADTITAPDLLAVRSLSVEPPTDAVFELLHGGTGRRVADLLTEIPTKVAAGTAAGAEHLADGSPADRAWRLLTGLDGIGWVTAGKILARKRPDLIPIYDDVVKSGLGAPAGAWSVFHLAMSSSEVADAVDMIRTDAQAPEAESDLRILDIVLWMHFRTSSRAGSSSSA